MLAINVSALQESLASSVDKVVESNEIIKICTNKGNAIIISEEDYNALLETLALQSDPRVIKKIKDLRLKRRLFCFTISLCNIIKFTSRR